MNIDDNSSALHQAERIQYAHTHETEHAQTEEYFVHIAI